MKPYPDLSARSQVDRIRTGLKEVLCSEWGLNDAKVRLVSQAYNTTFRIDSERGRFALRVNTASSHGMEKLAAEIAFVKHLTGAQTFKVAAPVEKLDGGAIAALEVRGFNRPVYAVLYDWLPDKTVGDNPTAEIMFALGRATCELHGLARSLSVPEGALPTISEPFYGDTYRLETADLDLPMFNECTERVMRVFSKLESEQRIPLHADLHFHNVKSGSGGLSIFDFDDAMVSWPIMDAAITMWYFRSWHNPPNLEPNYWAGFGCSPTDFGITPEEFETLVAARTLLLVNDIVGSHNATAQHEKIAFVRKCEANLKHYLFTGRFAPNEVDDSDLAG